MIKKINRILILINYCVDHILLLSVSIRVCARGQPRALESAVHS